MSLTDKKTVSGGFSNQDEWVRVEYDFSEDGGATGDYDVLESDGGVIITDFYAYVDTACTSGGAAVMDLGIDDGGTELWSDKAVGDLSAGSVHGDDAATVPYKLADGEKIVFGIETAALTAGKISFWFKLKRLG